LSHPAMTPDSVAVVTGGASGLGFAAAMRFARLGMKVCIADLGSDRLTEAEARLSSASPAGATNVMAAAVDVGNVEAVAGLESAVRDRFGGTDVLMNNAGIQPAARRLAQVQTGSAFSASISGA
jgi:NAD(P)-dependent dehydrogenase (short-subunit alcohol dehydrogenase family)